MFFEIEKKGIRVKLLILFLMFAFVPLFIVSITSFQKTTSLLEDETIARLETAGVSRAEHLETFIDENIHAVRLFIPHENIGSLFESDFDSDSDVFSFFNKTVQKTIYEHDGFVGFFMLDNNGNIVYSLWDKDSEIEQRILEEYHPIEHIHDMNEKDYSLEFYDIAGEYFLEMILVLEEDGVVYGTINIFIEATKFYEILLNREGLGETGEIYLVDSDYVMLSPSRFIDNTILKQKVDTENARTCFLNNDNSHRYTDGVVFKDYRGENVFGIHVYLENYGWCLLSEIDEAEAHMARKEFTNLLSILVFLVFVVSLVSAIIFSKNITVPIKKLELSANEMKKGNFSAKVDIATGDEFEDLAETMNGAMEVLAGIDAEHKQLDRAKTEFLSITSHELRSPMTPMKAQLQMLNEDYFGKLNEKQKQAVNIVLKNTVRLDNIIVDFLEISRIEAARLKFRFIKTDMVENINMLIEEMKGFLPEKSIEIKLDMGTLPVIEVDPDRVMQVLRNLINNAKKFSKENGVIYVSVSQKEDFVEFSVKDEGIGIAPENQRRVFEPFFQEEQTMYRKYGGTGLGLTICKGIIESQKGKLWLESKLGKGTSFYFTVPFTPVKEIKNIKLLFSPQENIEKRLKEILIEAIGPLGEREFEKMKKKGLEVKHILEYLISLRDMSIISDEKFNSMKDNVKQIFGYLEDKKNDGVS